MSSAPLAVYPDWPIRVQANAVAYLTRQQRRILLNVVAGYSNKEIAQNLYIEPDTVKTHMRRIYKATGTYSRLHLILWALNLDADQPLAILMPGWGDACGLRMRMAKLTPRETTLCLALLRGEDIEVMAANFNLAPAQVRILLSRLYTKTQTTSKTNLLAWICGTRETYD